MNYLLVLYNNEMDIFFWKKGNTSGIILEIYILSHTALLPSISRLIPKKIMDLQFGGLFK